MTSDCAEFEGGFASKTEEKAAMDVGGGMAFVIESGLCVEKNDARCTSAMV